MNFFEQTLRNIFENEHDFDQIRFIGRTAYGTIGDTIRLRFDIIDTSTSKYFNALKITTFNKNQGTIDTLILRFDDIWGVKKIDHPAFPEGIVPYIYGNNKKPYWYIYEPNEKDYKQLAATIKQYTSLYQ